MSEQYVKKSQTALKKAGVYSGAIDGRWGSRSHSSLMRILNVSDAVTNESDIQVNTDNENMSNPLPWITEAFKYKGMREVKGVHHSITILSWLKNLGAWWRDDETPWCGVFVAHCLKQSGRAIPKHWYRAKAYAEYGTHLNKPCYGCIGIMARTGGRHVCMIIGETKDGRLVVIGGNQNNSVSVAVYPRSRFTAFVFPAYADTTSLPYQYRYVLPVYDAANLNQPVNEA